MMLNTKIVMGIYKVKSVPEGFYSFKTQDPSLSLLRGAKDSKGPQKDLSICEKYFDNKKFRFHDLFCQTILKLVPCGQNSIILGNSERPDQFDQKEDNLNSADY